MYIKSITDSKEISGENYEQDIMIRATRESNISSKYLIEVFKQKGLIGVYNLGLKIMFDYLNDN